MADSEPQPTPSLHVTPERTIVPPKHGVELTDRAKVDCEMIGLDLIDTIVHELSPIKDSKGADITEKARTQLQQAWSDTFNYTLNHQRSNIHTRQGPEIREAANSLELKQRLRDSRDTMSAMMGRCGVQSESFSPARRTLHTEVMNRYPDMITNLERAMWGHNVAPARDSGRLPG